MGSSGMATQFRLLGWRAGGLRCPDHEINLQSDPGTVFPVSLIQMPNGTGKTTTLELLRAALSGAASKGEWEPAKIRSLRKRDSAVTEGVFQVSALHNDRRLTFTMNFDFDEGTVAYTTTLPSGMKTGFEPPRDLERFLRADFVKFFIFDGELAEQLLSHDHTNAQTAIEDLFQLKIFTSLSARVREYWDDVVGARGASDQRGLTRRRNRVAELRERLAVLRRDRAALREEHERIQQQLAAKEGRFRDAIAAREADRDRLQRVEGELRDAVHAVETLTKDLLNALRNPHAVSASFAAGLVILKTSLDRVKLPESAAREFFQELAEESHCVCGRPLDEETRQLIRDRSSQYFGSEDVALLNSMKSDIANLVGDDPASHEAELRTRIEAATAAIRRTEELRTEHDAVEAEAAEGDPDLEAARVEIRELGEQVDAIEEKLSAYDDPSDTASDRETFGIAVLERRLADAEHKLAEITSTLELKGKTDVLMAILQDAQNRARFALSSHICAEANTRISDLMPDNAIRISEINRCLVLEGQEGGSVGETLSVGYAFLATLFNRTDYQLPFVVDSPANPIDLRVRAKVADLIPRLANQFVAFTISSERQGFLDALERAAQGNIQYVTMFRRGSEALERKAAAQPDRKETEDGIAVYGREFFREFHVDAEA